MRLRETPGTQISWTCEAYSTSVNPYHRYPSIYIPVSWQQSYAAMKDEVGKKGFNACEHHAWHGWVSNALHTYKYNAIGDNTTWVPAAWCTYYQSGMWTPNQLLGKISALVGSASQYHYDLWKGCRPTLATRANLFVFLAELKDIKRMFDILPPKHFSLSDWRTVLSYVNSQHLNFNFGVKPFCRDLVSTFDALKRFDERLDKYLKNANRDLLQHRSLTKSFQTDETTDLLYGCKQRTVTIVTTCKYTSTYKYSYAVPYDGTELKLRAWIDALGLSPSLSNIWELIPYSFVVDWFVDVGGALKAQEDDWTAPILNWLGAGYSVKYTGSCQTYFSGPPTYGNSMTAMSSVRLDQYLRYPGLPKFQASVDSLDADKIRLGSSLILARLL